MHTVLSEKIKMNGSLLEGQIIIFNKQNIREALSVSSRGGTLSGSIPHNFYSVSKYLREREKTKHYIHIQFLISWLLLNQVSQPLVYNEGEQLS